MINEKSGKVVKGIGGLYEIRIDGTKERIVCRAKGNLKRDEAKVYIGDNVTVEIDDSTKDSVIISEIKPRKNSLIRPPMANLDYLFIVFSAKKPAPVTETIDKLISIAEHNGILPVVVITKCDLENTDELREIYTKAGIPTFVTSTVDMSGINELNEYIKQNVRDGKTAAFAGASGVGKSTLMNSLFPNLVLETQEISRKIERGRHTTRHVEIFDIDECESTGFLADTPGFSLIDFERFDFFSLDELVYTFREFSGYLGKCRYQDCAHFGEGADECAIIRATERGEVAKSRHNSYKIMYKALKDKKQYD